MAARQPHPDDFPQSSARNEGGEGNTIIDRALATARKRRLIPQPEQRDRGATTPKGQKVTRKGKKKPKRPSTKTGKREPTETKEVERSRSISQALLKGAAMVPESPISGTLRGLLGGASVGLDLQAAMIKHNQRRRAETVANAAMKMNASQPVAPTPSNTPFSDG